MGYNQDSYRWYENMLTCKNTTSWPHIYRCCIQLSAKKNVRWTIPIRSVTFGLIVYKHWWYNSFIQDHFHEYNLLTKGLQLQLSNNELVFQMHEQGRSQQVLIHQSIVVLNIKWYKLKWGNMSIQIPNFQLYLQNNYCKWIRIPTYLVNE